MQQIPIPEEKPKWVIYNHFNITDTEIPSYRFKYGWYNYCITYDKHCWSDTYNRRFASWIMISEENYDKLKMYWTTHNIPRNQALIELITAYNDGQRGELIYD